MVKSESSKVEETGQPATSSQINLILQLYQETNYTRQYTEAELLNLDREQASRHIHVLKETKVQSQALRSLNDRVPDFDKPGFGMVYKLVWHACAEMQLATKPSQDDFIDRVLGEYNLFKRTQAECRKHLQEGGLQ